METNYFEKLASINVTEFIEKKGQFSYLSWPFAVAQLAKLHPDSKWKIKKYKDVSTGQKLPYLKTDLGYFVCASVTINGIKRTQIHPVLDNRNKPIAKPSTFDINTSIQRCLVKAIALHGLGLYIYAGEDLPLVDIPHYTPEQKKRFDEYLRENKAIEFYAFINDLSPDIRATLHNSFETDKVKNKKAVNDLEKSGSELVDSVVKVLTKYSDAMDITGIKETVDELTKEEKQIIWARLNDLTKGRIKQAMQTNDDEPKQAEIETQEPDLPE